MQNPRLNVAIKALRAASKFLIQTQEHLVFSVFFSENPELAAEKIYSDSLQCMKETLLAWYPDAKIESGNTPIAMHAKNPNIFKKEAFWVLEPLNGVVNYLHQHPCYTSRISHFIGQEVEFSVLYDPLRDEIFCAEKGCGITCNGKRPQMERKASGRSRVISIGLSSSQIDQRPLMSVFLKLLDQLAPLSLAARISGNSALDLAYVSANRIDALLVSVIHESERLLSEFWLLEAGGIAVFLAQEKAQVLGVLSHSRHLKGISESIRSILRQSA